MRLAALCPAELLTHYNRNRFSSLDSNAHFQESIELWECAVGVTIIRIGFWESRAFDEFGDMDWQPFPTRITQLALLAIICQIKSQQLAVPVVFSLAGAWSV